MTKKIITPHSDEEPELSGNQGHPSLMTSDDDISLTDMLYRDPKLKPNDGSGAYEEL